MTNASTGSLVMKMTIEDAHELYDRITENHINWPIAINFLKKSVGVHNIDAVTALASQMEVITKKLDSLTRSINMLHQSYSSSCKLYHGKLPLNFHSYTMVNCPSASTHIVQPVEVSYT